MASGSTLLEIGGSGADLAADKVEAFVRALVGEILATEAQSILLVPSGTHRPLGPAECRLMFGDAIEPARVHDVRFASPTRQGPRPEGFQY
jgi:hypothetical protein